MYIEQVDNKVLLCSSENYVQYSMINNSGKEYEKACMCSITKLRLILCDPTDSSPPGFSVHGILQASILELVAISFSSEKRERERERERETEKFVNQLYFNKILFFFF